MKTTLLLFAVLCLIGLGSVRAQDNSHQWVISDDVGNRLASEATSELAGSRFFIGYGGASLYTDSTLKAAIDEVSQIQDHSANIYSPKDGASFCIALNGDYPIPVNPDVQMGPLKSLQVERVEYLKRSYGFFVVRYIASDSRHLNKIVSLNPCDEQKAISSELRDEATQDLLSSLPKGFSAREIVEIRKGEIVYGMRRVVLDYMLGKPDRTNDYGWNGDTQLVYDDGALIVYVRRGRVVNYQSSH